MKFRLCSAESSCYSISDEQRADLLRAGFKLSFDHYEYIYLDTAEDFLKLIDTVDRNIVVEGNMYRNPFGEHFGNGDTPRILIYDDYLE